MNCCFIGHADTPFILKNNLKEAVKQVISEGVLNFFVGNNGNFDWLVQNLLVNMINDGYAINLYVVLSYPNEKSICAPQSYTIYPEGIENTPPRFAITKRNDIIINKSSFMIAYVKNNFSNSHKWLEKAKKKGIKIINLAD